MGTRAVERMTGKCARAPRRYGLAKDVAPLSVDGVDDLTPAIMYQYMRPDSRDVVQRAVARGDADCLSDDEGPGVLAR